MSNTLEAIRFRRTKQQDVLAPTTNHFANANNPVSDVNPYAPIDGLSTFTRYLLSEEGRRNLGVKTARLDAERRAWNESDRERYIAHLYLCHAITDFYVARERATSPYLRPSSVAAYRAHMESLALDVQSKVEELFPTAETTNLEEDDSLVLENLTEVIEEVEPQIPPATILDKRFQSPAEKCCYIVAKERGLDASQRVAMVDAFNRYQGTNYTSRKDLTVKDWEDFLAAIQAGTWLTTWGNQQLFKTKEEALRRAA